MILTRPGTLAQVLRLVRSGEKFRFCMAGFLDEFYGDTSNGSRAARIAEDPGLTGDPKTDALLGAIGEHLASRWNLGAAPHWTQQPERFLDKPWFMGHERMKGFLLAESPLSFRRRFIFTEAEPLRRASMPRDGRWWAYETIRTGMTPTAEEQAELDQHRAPAMQV
ncbi:hypothetical protein [Bradyrhizobium yuanmingense]|uniref:hypothetical protein n=1 Tax=Bradyrhizobium yuanmingense TaxID=108015 RepID=UPI0023B9D9E8|nr:hypothetical protein [Bradyrhizobium yuanmingense]MDF0498253.1 hypothetical protein [Bradyrhizobium yuanmingense]